MPRVLIISSMVARGHVGLSAIVPVLQGLACETVALPTVLLSNHPGHTRFAGQPVPVKQLEDMLEALDGNGWLRDIDAVLTGYFPTAAHVSFAAGAVRQVQARNARVHVCCDPVLGDDPGGLYVTQQVAAAVHAQLLPLSQSITPNRFELEWLSKQPLQSPSDAVTAARALGLPLALVTSVPSGQGELSNVAVTANDAWSTSAPRRHGVPHGTGDALSAAFLAAQLSGLPVPDSLATAAGSIEAIVAASLGHDELQLATSRAAWSAPAMALVDRLR
ncbi:MAG: pyridoxal kinase [Hyphomicrobiaceae bacterium]|nr:pyridoxal kinase [Hyphomicrobiaceae bacterium]